MESAGKLTVKKKVLKTISGRHPWIFSGAVKEVTKSVAAGGIVDLVDQDGNFLGRGFFNPNSQIAVRILTFDDTDCGINLISERLKQAIDLRKSLPEYELNTAWRLVYAETDFLPGLVVDYYSGYVNMQFHSAGWETIKSDVVKIVAEITECNGIYDGSDPEMRNMEGLDTENATIYGSDPPELISVSEFGRVFKVDIRHGHKSGLYLDQKFNHQDIIRYAKNRKVLDVFSYTGGFGLAALEAGCSSLTCIDISKTIFNLLKDNIESNGYDQASVTLKTGDAFEIMREMVLSGERFDMIILDPPAFCRSKSAVIQACRGYKDINRLAMQLLAPDSVLVSCSCSRPVSDELFVKVLWQASIEAEREAKLLKLAGQSPDHPVLLTFPESKYLKCATLLVH